MSLRIGATAPDFEADTTEGRRVVAKIAAHPELFEIGNHTVHHCDFVNGGGGSPLSAPCQRDMTASFIRQELTRAETALLRQTGLSTKPYWRPPYGAHNAFVRDHASVLDGVALLSEAQLLGGALGRPVRLSVVQLTERAGSAPRLLGSAAPPPRQCHERRSGRSRRCAARDRTARAPSAGRACCAARR